MFNMKLCFRADYWKSQGRKYCDFCKCWLSDNKPSIEFHEKGKKHKANVEKRLKTITKQSVKEQKNAVKMDEAIQKMEQAALEAYKKDLENNADLTGRSIRETIDTNNLQIAESSSTSEISKKESKKEKLPVPVKKKTPWYEAKTPEGFVYYWNTETNESVWDPPPEGFLTFEEQNNKAENEGQQQLKAIEEFNRNHVKLLSEQEKLSQEEQRAAAEREKMKALRVNDEPEKPTYFAPIGPPERSNPYGQWKTVTKKESKVDWQLPQQEYVAINVPTLSFEPKPKVFQERTISSIDSSCSTDTNVGFKKRKFVSVQKKNARQRLDTDD